ncbi:sodium:calcium antiporter [Mesorhizobium sp. Root157]|uniref:calcium/sodium antiporter n=1 Tax=Mesorhizobium sp. Root157 TaxID=1736477 RepID=UPI0006F7D039|nr:calcium/sodium antiporter [Mesorhizobium sp. Root157]KQZ96288.1 sodium:calcium antiporter [Mesorhizobium sp. Root157]
MSAIFWCGLALVALVVGAELLVRAGSRLSALIGIPPILIGLTVVAIGTSTPELAVGIDAALQGKGSLAVGNIAGTNIFNILFILGLSAAFLPLAMEMRTLRFDLPVMTVAACALLAMAWDGILTRVEGAILVGAAIIYTAAVIGWARRESRAVRLDFAKEHAIPASSRESGKVASNLAGLGIGIVVIAVGAEWLVDGAVELARIMGVSDAFIGLTVVAIGTSAPELVTTVISTLRQERDIAVGNLLGSSIYNILFILGTTTLVQSQGIEVEPVLIYVDLPVMVATTIACVPIFISGRRITRLEGMVFVGAYIAYLTYLIASRV